MKNIVLIGMPGAGKSTMGVILARALRMNFVDADIVIQQQEGRLLQEIIDAEGPDAFRHSEEQAILSLDCSNTVIATGGSVVYSERAMAHLKRNAIVVYLRISFAAMERRLGDITSRGIVLHRGRGLRGMYDERAPLYERYADITADCTDRHFAECAGDVIGQIRALQPGAHPQGTAGKK